MPYLNTNQSIPTDGDTSLINNTDNRPKPIRHKNKMLIVGKWAAVGLSASGVAARYTLAAARQFKALYCVDNVDHCVEIDELVQFVSSLGVRVISCFKVKPRLTLFQRNNNIKPAHSTFRLCINRADTKQLLQAEKWPSDILISEWFFSNKSHGSINKNYNGSNIINRPLVIEDSAEGSTDCIARSIVAIRGNSGETNLLNESPVDMDATIIFNAAGCDSSAVDKYLSDNLESSRIGNYE
jgi:hypothetical protein